MWNPSICASNRRVYTKLLPQSIARRTILRVVRPFQQPPHSHFTPTCVERKNYYKKSNSEENKNTKKETAIIRAHTRNKNKINANAIRNTTLSHTQYYFSEMISDAFPRKTESSAVSNYEVFGNDWSSKDSRVDFPSQNRRGREGKRGPFRDPLTRLLSIALGEIPPPVGARERARIKKYRFPARGIICHN